MLDSFSFPEPPKGVSRLLYRLPIALYRGGLGAVFGRRFLLLQHRGRKSGLPRRAVLEVIRFDKERGRYLVVSAFGDRSDWYRNVVESPEVKITVGGSVCPAVAQILSGREAEEEIVAYASKHPLVFRLLVRSLLGYPIGKEKGDLVRLARKMIVVAFDIVEPGRE
jgi:deazaflavin-dependent oxidoreductase (nitroreductase family)